MVTDPELDDTNVGFNSDVSYRSLVYHVQTESMADSGPSSINTLVYLKGALVFKISTPGSTEPGESFASSLRERAKRQHQDVLRRARRGEFAA